MRETFVKEAGGERIDIQVEAQAGSNVVTYHHGRKGSVSVNPGGARNLAKQSSYSDVASALRRAADVAEQ